MTTSQSFTVRLNDVRDLKQAEVFGTTSCLECGDTGPLATVTNADAIDEVAHLWGRAHSYTTGHVRNGVWRVSYSPGGPITGDRRE